MEISNDQYLSLVTLARAGARINSSEQALEVFLRAIEKQNGVTRDVLLVQWQEQDTPLPPHTDFPAVWPPEYRALLERTDRPIARVDVEALLKQRARRPVNVLVTKDVTGIAGWSTLDAYFLT